ncbi:protein APEM9-like [Phragmites australis]|uniref:protein APEM9-like n=1 Tax=Phragmites australis TaxID=29695 RepID=UPI002D78897C|nr:protein APEM9-like [Phragmites australis]
MMEASAQESGLWKQIDDAEYNLVSGSFEQAVSTALSVSDQIRSTSLENGWEHGELLEMHESAGMVLVQALKELRRTSEMFVHLKVMFGSVPSVSAKVFLTGATMQMAAGSGSDLRPIFEEYLAKWRYTNDEVYVLNGQDDSSNGFVVTSIMSSEQYLEVAELYAVTFLSIVSQDSETAISWAKKAELTEQNREDLLKKLHVLQSAANKKSSSVKGVKQTAERNLSTSTNGSTPSLHEDAPNTVPVYNELKKGCVKSTQPSIHHVANQFDPLFWWFHSIRLKFGKIHIVLPSGKLMLLFSLLFSTIYVLRRKTTGLKRTVFQHVSSLRRAFFDALQLAFSVQMNPLAAVQQVPQAPRGSW